jgi:alanyl-tRNA synthetase
MTVDEVRTKYIEFFKKSPRNHKEISPAPLVPVDDPSTLFTSSGMQQLVPYLLGESHPEGKRLVDSQPVFRAAGYNDDIEEVGDNRHLTYFEMLGNWSLGDYFKKEQLSWFYKFVTSELKLPKDRLQVSVFEGAKGVPKDVESAEIWKKIGIPEKRIVYYGVDKNWWSRSGPPDIMPAGEIGGPDSEMFYEFPDVEHSPKYGKECHPNCDCGRFLELGNSVFIQYRKKKDGSLEELPHKNVDFGGGLERFAAAIFRTPDLFQTDLFLPTIQIINEHIEIPYGDSDEKDKSIRIVADHLRGSVALISEGVIPSNKMQGYILRRLIRRSVFHFSLLKPETDSETLVRVAEGYKDMSESVSKNWNNICKILSEEGNRFSAALSRGMAKLSKALEKKVTINGKFAFDLYQTEGFPLELTLEVLKQNKIELSESDRKQFKQEFEKHRSLSRKTSAGVFRGGLADSSKEVTKLHTATHLLHASLRKVLGKTVEQKGSNVTAERLRFDFSNPDKLTDVQINKVEEIVNDQVSEDLSVICETKAYKQALDEGALAFFGERYKEKVKVYTIGKSKDDWFSKEVCGGPHVKSTSEIGRVRIKRQQKLGSGIIRLYATVE